nr:hypothetical protein [Actinomycetota bacterium]
SQGQSYGRAFRSHGRRTPNPLASDPGAVVFDRLPLSFSTGLHSMKGALPHERGGDMLAAAFVIPGIIVLILVILLIIFLVRRV